MSEVKSLYNMGYEQGVKDTLDKYDETLRIASDIRCAMGCKTVKECRDLISNGEIQRVKHGRWIPITKGAIEEIYMCNRCHRTIKDGEIPALIPQRYPYCHCGARMDMDEVKE